MSKQQLNATELVNTEVNFVSLVKRGANRIPFRITKEDQDMIDLHKIGRAIFKMAEPKIEVVGAILQKSADVDKVNAVLKSAGLDPEALVKTEHDGVVTLTKADSFATGSVLKVSDEVGLVVNVDLQKAFSGVDFSSWSFGEVLATEGYFVGVCTAVDVLKSTVANILMEASSSSEAASAVGKAVDEMKNYLISLTGGIPVQAFKADVAFSKAGSLAKAEEAPAEAKKEDEVKAEKSEETEAPVEKADEATVTEVTKENVNPMDESGSDKKEKDKKKEEAPAETQKAESADEKNAEADDKAKAKKDAEAAVEKAADKGKELDDSKSGAGAEKPKDAPAVKADNSEILAAIAELRKSVEDEISGVKKSVSDISDRVEQVSKLAKKTDADLNGTVFNDAGGDAPMRTQKSDGAIPLLDTAYTRRTA
jgi:hypothetical protein